MSQRQLRRELREQLEEHKILRAEEYEISDSPDGIQHFENYYLEQGTSLKEVNNKLGGMRQFPRHIKMHIREHFEVKREIKRLNKRLKFRRFR